MAVSLNESRQLRVRELSMSMERDGQLLLTRTKETPRERVHRIILRINEVDGGWYYLSCRLLPLFDVVLHKFGSN